MALSAAQAVDRVKLLLDMRRGEGDTLDRLHSYWRGQQALPVVPTGVPSEVRRLAEMSRVNLLTLVVDVLAQGLFVDGFREPRASENDAQVWAIWQANRMDSRQVGVHRAAFAYGVSYVLVLPGDPNAVLRPVSPRKLTAAYGLDDDEWPQVALESTGPDEFRLYDDQAIYFVNRSEAQVGSLDGPTFSVVDVLEHGLGVCPVVRFKNHEDLDGELVGEIEPLIPLQDQLDHTTFGLLVAQHYQSFRQRYILGWTSPDESVKAKASASRLWTFDDPDVKVGEFGQVDLGGYLESRQATGEYLATLSQTPPHQLLGKLVNLSAEALAAAEAGQHRKLGERETGFGESWEQALRLAATADGVEVSDDAQVRWRDTEARSLSQTVDALGKMAQMLGIPPQALWERVPGVSQQDVEEWKALAVSGDSLLQLTSMLDNQATMAAPTAADPADLKAKADALGSLIRAGVDPDQAAIQVGLAGLKFTGAVPVSLRLPQTEAAQLENA